MADIPMEPTLSSNVKSIGFDAETGTVKVEFVSRPGTYYEYLDVSPEDYAAIRSAPSLGSAVNKYLVRGPYQSRKV